MRFRHLPPDPGRDVNAQLQQIPLMQQALRTGQPVPGWVGVHERQLAQAEQGLLD